LVVREEAVVETIVERAAGLDVHKAQVTACVRVPGQGRERAQDLAEFQTTVRGLLALRDWLKAHRVTQVAMEATGVYCPGSRCGRSSKTNSTVCS
jgi:transposase